MTTTSSAASSAATAGSTDTTPEQLESVLAAAAAAAATVADTAGAERAAWLRAVGTALDEARSGLVDLAVTEAHLARGALDTEVNRTIFQLEHLADAAESPDVLGLVVESADPDYPVAPRPDLVQALRPIGPVLVFTASNFPFAFSVAGNDFASALAAGCPVIVKANPGHPQLSRETARVVGAALTAAGAPDGTFAHIEGFDAGVTALRDERVRACGFTGSVRGGRALFDIAVNRPDPIPFYGELGSLNPVFVTPAAAAARAEQIATEFAGSFTFRGGQLCTKPGVLIAPGRSGIGEATARAVGDAAPVELLTTGISTAYVRGVEHLTALPGARVEAASDSTTPALVRIPIDTALADDVQLEECFGPASVVIEYDDANRLPALARKLGPALTATIQGEADDDVARQLAPTLTELAGRLVWNGWPTGVAVTRALHHGGPYPATTTPTAGSIGAGSVARWLRPVTYQNYPIALLPRPIRAAVEAASSS